MTHRSAGLCALDFRCSAAALALGLAALGCESSDSRPIAPAGDAFARYVAIGTGISMGVQAGGVWYDAQQQAWPALLAHAAAADFTIPLLRSPGCTPPLVAPLQTARYLSRTSTLSPDTSCAGALGTTAPPFRNLALWGATAWSALYLTPKAVAAALAPYDAGDRARYPLVLGSTQSQVTAMVVQGPTLVSIELGANEVLGAVTAGLLVPAGSYTQAARYTFVPAAVFAPAYAAIADSVKRTGARALLFSVPKATRLVSLRAGSELYAERNAFSAFGITVSTDCAVSPNLVFTAALVPTLVARALLSASVQTLSCADVPGQVDYVLTPGDIATLDAAVDQMNSQIRQLADQNGWAFGDANRVLDAMAAARAAYSLTVQLTCVHPYGQYLSLDGVNPNVEGHQLMANVAATALNAEYRFTLPSVRVRAVPQSQLCP